MRVDAEIFQQTARHLADAGGGVCGPCSDDTAEWAVGRGIPTAVVELFKRTIPKTEVWAGSGVLFDESRIVRWNEDFPEALRAQLLILGSAPNGDHIALDLAEGQAGYICHEEDWQQDPRRFFVAVSESIGTYLRDVNSSQTDFPEDYWAAKAGGE